MSILKKITHDSSQEAIKQPEGTDEIVPVYDFIIPDEFKRTDPRTYKIKKATKYYCSNGMFDKPVTVIPITNEQGFHTKFF